MVLSNNNQARVVSIKNTVATFFEGFESFVDGFELPTALLLTPRQTNRIAFRCMQMNDALQLDSSLRNTLAASPYDDFVFLYSAPFRESGIEDKRYAVLNINALRRFVETGKISVDYLIDGENTYDVVQLLPAALSTKPEKKGEYGYDVVKTSDGEQICLRDLAKEALERRKEQPLEIKKTPERE